MNQVLAILFFTSVCLTVDFSASAQNLLENPGFELGTDANGEPAKWDIRVEEPFSMAVDNTVFRTGSSSFRFDPNLVYEDLLTSMVYPIGPDDFISIAGYLRTDPSSPMPPEANFTIFAYLNDGRIAGSVGAPLDLTDLRADEWTLKTASFRSYDLSILAEIISEIEGGHFEVVGVGLGITKSQGSFFMDDLTLAIVPESSTSAMLLMGFVMLFMFLRKAGIR